MRLDWSGSLTLRFTTQTEGCSGAEIASICQDAALSAMNEDMNTPSVSWLAGMFIV